MTKLYHVLITSKEPVPSSRRRESEFDLSFEDLERRFLTPYSRAEPIVIKGRMLTIGDLVRIEIFETERKVLNLAQIPWNIMTDVTSDFILGPPGWESEEQSTDVQRFRPPADTRDVFVVHGRNLMARDALFDFLRSIDLHPVEWSEAVHATGKPAPYVGEILDAAFSRAHAVVVLFTPDDEARLRESLRTDSEPPHETDLTGQARPNVLFEAGMAMGRSEDRTVLVELGSLRPFSDVAGRHVIRLDKSSQRRQELAQRLRAAGCPVNLEGTDWHTAGDFESVVDSLVQIPSVPETTGHQYPPVVLKTLKLSEEAMELIVEAARDSKGMIISIRSFGGLSIETNGKNFVESGDVRTEAKWEQALMELHEQGLVEDPAGKGEVFKVTHKGFETADSLGTSA